MTIFPSSSTYEDGAAHINATFYVYLLAKDFAVKSHAFMLIFA